MNRIAVSSWSAALLVAALDGYFIMQIVDSLHPSSLNCASSQVIMMERTRMAAMLLIPATAAAFAVHEVAQRHARSALRIPTFLPIAIGVALLVVTKVNQLW